MSPIDGIDSATHPTGRSLAYSFNASVATEARPGSTSLLRTLPYRAAGRDEARQHRRYQTASPVPCRIGLLSALVEDVSLVGLGIRAPSPLRIGQSYSINIQEGQALLSFPVLVTRSYLVGFETTGKDRPPIYRIGLDFREALDEHAGEILAFFLENVVIHRPPIVAVISVREPGFEGESIECPVESLSSRAVELIAPRIGPSGTRVLVSLHQGSSSVCNEAVISSQRSGALGGSVVSLRPSSTNPAARFDFRELIQQQIV